MSPRKAVKRQNLTLAQREDRRQKALKLMEAGKWGGRGPDGHGGDRTWGQGGKKRPRFAPKFRELVAILEAMEAARHLPHERSAKLRKLWAAVPEDTFREQRSVIVEVITEAMSAALFERHLPHTAIFGPRKRVELPLNGGRRRPLSYAERRVVLYETRPEDFSDYTMTELLVVLTFLGDCFMYPTLQSHEADDLLDGLVGELRAEVEGELRERGVEITANEAWRPARATAPNAPKIAPSTGTAVSKGMRITVPEFDGAMGTVTGFTRDGLSMYVRFDERQGGKKGAKVPIPRPETGAVEIEPDQEGEV